MLLNWSPTFEKCSTIVEVKRKNSVFKGMGVVICYLSIPPHNNSRVVVRNLRILVYRSSLGLTITHLKVNLVTVVFIEGV